MSIAELNAARELIKTNPEQYPSLVRGVLPVGDRPEVDIRRWCAGFVADFFGAESVGGHIKDEIALEVLNVLSTWVSDSNSGVAKLGINILSEVYPRIYSRTLTGGHGMKSYWETVSDLKTKALARWGPREKEGVVVACIKLAEIVVHTNYQAVPAHPVLDQVLLQAEGVGLLDRLLSLFPGTTTETYGVVSATVNSVVALAIVTPALAPRIVSYIVTFDLSKRVIGTPAQGPLVLRWIGKLFKLALYPLSRNFPQIPKYLAGLSSYCTNQSLKRRAAEDDDGPTSPAKRAKRMNPNLPPGPQPYKALYTLVDNLMAGFYAGDLQFDLAVSMATAGLARIETEDLDDCIDIVKNRLSKIDMREANDASTSESSADAGVAPETAPDSKEPSKSSASPPPQQQQSPPKTEESAKSTPTGPSRAALEIKVPPGLSKFNEMLNRLLGEAPIRVVARLSARGLAGSKIAHDFTQEKLYAQLVPDFRTTLEPLVLWLSEEYYADGARESYFDLVAKVVDEIIPKLEVSDSRTFVRLLSELPELNREIIFKIRSICLDPDRAVVGARALKFLIMFKPPCREDCLDLIEELIPTGAPSMTGVLEKYRPAAVKQEDPEVENTKK